MVARDGYTFLDLLADVGGIQGLLISGVAMFMAFWNYNYFDNYMASRLYKTYSPKEERKESEFMKPWPFFN